MSRERTDRVAGRRIREARRLRGWSQARLVRELRTRALSLGLTLPDAETIKPYVSRWENGHSLPDEMYSRLLREVLGLTNEDLGAGRGVLDAEPPGADAELQARLNFGRIDRALVEALQQQTDGIRRIDREHGARVLLDQTRSVTTTIEAAITHTVDPTARAPLARVLADAAALAGWQSLDLGSPHHAWRHFEIAKGGAREADDTALLAFATAEQAYVLLDIGKGEHASHLVRFARERHQRHLPGQVISWLYAAEAEFAAADGDEKACGRSLDRAQSALDRDVRAGDTPYVALNDIHLERWRGHCLARLGRGDAIQSLSDAAARMDGTFTRARAGLAVDLAVALHAAGEAQDARRQTLEAMNLALRTGSLRHERRLRSLVPADYWRAA